MAKPAVFLDRDNTLIRNDGDLGDPDEVVLLPGAASAVASLRGLGFRIVVVTNQGGVARGKYGEADVDAVHQRMAEQVHAAANGARFDGFYYCPYHPQGSVPEYTCEHEDRKPQPGMLLRAAQDLDLDLSTSWMVGDQMRDVQAGAAAGARTVLLRDDADRLLEFEPANTPGVTADTPEPGQPAPAKPDLIATSLVEAVRLIAQQRHAVEATEPSADAAPVAGRKWDAAAVARLQQQARPRRQNDPPPAAPMTPQGTPEDAPEPRRSSEPAPAKPENASRFKPWTAPGNGEADTPIATTKFQRVLSRVREGAKDDPAHRAPTAPAETQARPSATAVADPPQSVGARPAPAKPGPRRVRRKKAAVPASDAPHDPASPETVSKPAVSPAPTSAPSETPSDPQNDPPTSARSERLLRSILQELRNQRGRTAGDVTTTRIAALALQAGAALCLAGALVMGANDLTLFARWMAVGLLLQLSVLALLGFER
ncbi:MAG: HAD-IIIA family hydrolase [Planctomycetota bacterium]